MADQQLKARVLYVAQRCLKSVKHNADRRIGFEYGLDISGATTGNGTLLEILNQGGAGMVYHSMSNEDVERIIRYPYTTVASDGGTRV